MKERLDANKKSLRKDMKKTQKEELKAMAITSVSLGENHRITMKTQTNVYC